MPNCMKQAGQRVNEKYIRQKVKQKKRFINKRFLVSENIGIACRNVGYADISFFSEIIIFPIKFQ